MSMSRVITAVLAGLTVCTVVLTVVSVVMH
jgi:hypothetical protein